MINKSQIEMGGYFDVTTTLKSIVFKLHKLKSNDVQCIDLNFS